MSLLAAWKQAKDLFEKTTGRKKPSEKTWLGFRKSTGIEDALKALDKARTREEMERSVKAFKSAVVAYSRILDANRTDPENEQSYAAEIRKLEDTLKNLEREAESMEPPGIDQNKKIGPLRFDLLSGVRCPNLQPPGQMSIDVAIAVDFKGGETFDAARFTEVVSDYVNGERKQLRELVETADGAIGELTKVKGYLNSTHRAERLANAERLAKEVNDYLTARKSEIVKEAEKRVAKLAREISDRDVDLDIYRVRTAVKVGFGVFNVATAARKLFTEPPGLNVLKALWEVVSGIAGIVQQLKVALSGAERLRSGLSTALDKLEAKRQLSLKQDRTTGESAKNVLNGVLEILMDDIGSARLLLTGFQAETTKLEKSANTLSGKLDQLLTVQRLLGREEPEIERKVSGMIEKIQGMAATLSGYLGDVTAFKGSLDAVERDCSRPVKLLKAAKDAYGWLDAVGFLEKSCDALIDMAQAAMKK
jgi:hypothetical protein